MAMDKKAALDELKAARRTLQDAHSKDKGSRRQSDECGAANARVAEAEKNVAWWRR